MDDRREPQTALLGLLGEDPAPRRPEPADREVVGRELADVVDPDDRPPLERLAAPLAREVLDERRDLELARLLGELRDLEGEIARAQDQKPLLARHPGRILRAVKLVLTLRTRDHADVVDAQSRST